jgi:uncharacterized protein YgbK (DUF1537 family)
MHNWERMIVIADDITGAAEIAGLAFEQGRQVRLVCGGGEEDCDTVAAQGTIGNPDRTAVVATDTRSMTVGEAVAETRRTVAALGLPQGKGCRLFKKTDSALRGHVVAELAALMDAAGFQRAVYLPANPSKGRIIRDGVYYIDGTPIHQTAFSYDPEFPATTAVLKERFPDAAEKGIVMPDAESMEDIRRVVDQYDDGQTLFAGAADLFRALLSPASPPAAARPAREPQERGPLLILRGSTQSKALDLGIPVAPMPREIYDGANDLSLWDTSAYKVDHGLILSIPYTHRTGKEVATHLRQMMAEEACRVINSQILPSLQQENGQSLHLIIEGGATAWATLQALGWNDFCIEQQIAPGVVQMSATNGTLVTLKPGSYPWGNLFQ